MVVAANPVGEVGKGGPELLPGGPPFDATASTTGLGPVKLEAQKVEASAAGQIELTEAKDSGLVRSYFEPKLAQPLTQIPEKGLRIEAVLERADKVVSKTGDHGCPARARLDPPFKPKVQRIVV